MTKTTFFRDSGTASYYAVSAIENQPQSRDANQLVAFVYVHEAIKHIQNLNPQYPQVYLLLTFADFKMHKSFTKKC